MDSENRNEPSNNVEIPEADRRKLDRILDECSSGDDCRKEAALDELKNWFSILDNKSPLRKYIMEKLRPLAAEERRQKAIWRKENKIREFHWRIFPVADPETIAALVVFYEDNEDGSGYVDVIECDDKMRSLVIFYLEDPFKTRPLYFADTGTVEGPHTRTFGQIDRSLMMFNNQFPAYDAERLSAFPPE